MHRLALMAWGVKIAYARFTPESVWWGVLSAYYTELCQLFAIGGIKLVSLESGLCHLYTILARLIIFTRTMHVLSVQSRACVELIGC